MLHDDQCCTILQVLDDLINRAKDTRQELDLEDLQVSALHSY
jgi:hypothetical protein